MSLAASNSCTVGTDEVSYWFTYGITTKLKVGPKERFSIQEHTHMFYLTNIEWIDSKWPSLWQGGIHFFSAIGM